MKTQIFLALLVITQAACAPATTPVPTATSTPSAVPPTLTATATFAIPTPLPFPTQLSIPFITPDAIQVERWKEYQTELAKSLLPKDPPEVVLCEWVILGRSGQEMYVAAVCLGTGRATAPAVIYLDTDGAILSVEAVGYGSSRDFNIQRLFPPVM